MFSPEDHRMLAYAPRPVPLDHRRWKTTVDVAPNCPRCDSSNTKFCYYNNYSLTQPRYFCKGCRRYWTKGGSLRNVPVGGGCRKNRRGKAVRLSSSDSVLTRCPSHEMDGSRTRAAEPGVRPDQALDDMFDRCHGPETGGSNIDMAVMYARYLNQTALPKSADEAEDSYGFVPELSSSSTPSTDLNCHLSEFGIGNSGGMESPTIFPTMNVDAFSMSVYPNLGWAAQELGRTPPVEIGQNNHHFQELLIGDWTSIEQSGFEAF